MSRWLLLIPLIFMSSPVFAQDQSPDSRSREILERARQLTAVDADGCLLNTNADEIVVCASFDPNREHRLPFPGLTASGEDPIIRGDIPRASAARVKQGRCGTQITDSGCTGGLDVLSIFGLLGTKFLGVEENIPDGNYAKEIQTQHQPRPSKIQPAQQHGYYRE